MGFFDDLGGGLLGGRLFGGDMWDDLTKREEIPLKATPEYPEAEAARKNWWQTLQDWQKSGDYGATDMNWDEIFNTAKTKLNQYYWGGPMDTGLEGKVKASAARRNVSQSPALENMLVAMGAQEAQDISSLETGLTTQKAQYTERARGNWLQSLMGLSGQQMSSYYPQYEESTFDQIVKLLGAIGQTAGAVGGMGGF